MTRLAARVAVGSSKPVELVDPVKYGIRQKSNAARCVVTNRRVVVNYQSGLQNPGPLAHLAPMRVSVALREVHDEFLGEGGLGGGVERLLVASRRP